jgi:hypothetical protein
MGRMATAAILMAWTFVVAAPASAQEPFDRIQLDTGLKELSFWLGVNVDEGDDALLGFGGDVGFLVSPRHELGATVQSSLGCGGFYRYNFPIDSRRVVPFIGARAVGYLGEYQDWDAEVRAEGGIRRFIGRGTAIDLSGYWGRRIGPDCEGAYCPDDSDFAGISVGVSLFF